jgi:hypothetical protein
MRTKGKDIEWTIYDDFGKTTWELVPIAVLMDIRDELKQLNRLLTCDNFITIPFKLDRIALNTAKRKRKKRPANVATP